MTSGSVTARYASSPRAVGQYAHSGDAAVPLAVSPKRVGVVAVEVEQYSDTEETGTLAAVVQDVLVVASQVDEGAHSEVATALSQRLGGVPVAAFSVEEHADSGHARAEGPVCRGVDIIPFQIEGGGNRQLGVRGGKRAPVGVIAP